MKEFSLFNTGVLQKTPSSTVDIKFIAESIRTEEFKKITEQYRNILDKTEKANFKKTLPLATFSGTFKSRKVSDLITHSGLLCVDCDHVGTNGEIKKIQTTIREYFNPALMFVSPGGDGLKVVFAIDINEGTHLEYFTSLRKFFDKEIGLKIDEACKDVSRACFLVHDPEVFYTDKPDVLNSKFIALATPDNSLLVEEAVIDDTSQYENAKKWVNSKEVFTPGNRNIYMTTLVDTLNRYGVNKNFVLRQLGEFACEDFLIKEIEAIVQSRYNHVEHHGIANGVALVNDTPGKKDEPFIRVGTTFYKIIRTCNRYGTEETHLKPWNKDTILQDYKKIYLQMIPRYDDFTMAPDNLTHKPIIKNCVNLYAPFNHTPAPGEWTWTERLLRHVFCEQYDLGIRYMQILYLHPHRSTIILVLISKERGTGKTTFLNWIDMLFGANVALISSTDFLSGFNGHYAQKNIICIEESCFDKNLTIEKLKALTTQKVIQINEKFIQQYKIPFYGKIIMTSNHENRFAKIDPEEIRFLIRKLGKPEFTNHAIEDDLLQEIPAFLSFLQSLPPVDWTVSRSGFTAEELRNTNLDEVMQESRSGLFKDLKIEIEEFFNNNELKYFDATPIDLKNKFFYSNNQITPSYIRRILKEEFNMQPTDEALRYDPFGDHTVAMKHGRYYHFERCNFTTSQIQDPF